MRILQGTESWFTIERGNPCQVSPRTGLFRKFRHGQWRSGICEQTQRPCAKQTEKNVERCRVRWRTFNNMVNADGYNVKCGDIHGKEFLNLFKVLSRFMKVSPWNRCSMSQRSWWTIRKKFIVWSKLCTRRILGHNCHWLMIQWSSIFKAQRSTYSQILCYVSAKFFNIPNPTMLGWTGLQESDPRKATEIMMLSTESRLNSSGTFSQDSQRCSSVMKSVIFWAIWDKHQNLSQEEFYSCQCSMTSCDRKDNKDECSRNAESVKIFARRFGFGQWSFIGPGSEKKWYSSECSPQGAWDNIAEQMLLEFAESGHPIFRATTPLSRGNLKSKGRGKLSIHFAADQDTIDTIYRIILSVNQLSVYGAVAAICEEFENHQDRTGEPEILMGQSIVLGEVKAETPLQNENPMNDQIIRQQYIQQVESLSPENKVSKFCKEAGFMRVVEVGQYFVTSRHWRLETISLSGLSRIHFVSRWSSFSTKKDGFKEIWGLDLYWK